MARMKRFTKLQKREDYHVTNPKNIRRDYREDFTGPAVEQLAAYEDTGLTPTQVLSLLGERDFLLTEIGMLKIEAETLRSRLASTESEREYFRSRAEFFREMALCKQEGK